VWPSPEIRISGCGTASAQTTASTSTAEPAQRSGVRKSPSRTIPALAAISGPIPNAAMRPIAPGKPATHSVTTIIQSMPQPMSCQNTPSSPNGIARRPSRPAGITTADTTGIAARLATTPYGVTR